MSEVVTERVLECVGYEQIPDLSSAVPLNPPKNASYAIIQAEAEDVRWRADGTDPDATTGTILAAGDSIPYTSDLSQPVFIEAAATAILNVHYFK